MSIVVPIVAAAVAIGLFARKVTGVHWFAMVVWIALVLAYNYFLVSRHYGV